MNTTSESVGFVVVTVLPEINLIRKVKRPIGTGVWAAYVLDEDEHGLWLYTPPGSLFRGEDGQAIITCEVGQGPGDPGGRPVLQLIQRDAWWTAAWNGGDAELAISVEICRPPVLVGAEWRFVDLELDPYRRVDGVVGTDDWDDFLQAYAAGLITRAEHDAAREAAAQMERWLSQRVEPFGEIGQRRLDAAIAMSLPPLLDLGDTTG